MTHWEMPSDTATEPKTTGGPPSLFETHPLFATPLWLATHPDASRLNPLLRSHVIAAMEADAGVTARKGSNRLGWRSQPCNLDEIEIWAPIAAFVREVLQELLYKEVTYSLYTTGANVHLEGGFNVSHIHPGCLISGVYYISCPPGGGDLVFEEPRAQAAFANTYRLFRQDWGAEQVELTPHEGLLVLFPSWLPHRVERSTSFEPRISLPINVVLRTQPVGGPAVPAPRAVPSGMVSGGRPGATRGFGLG